MEKDEKRKDFRQKQVHQQKEKGLRSEEVHLSQVLREAIPALDLKGIIDYMNDRYEKDIGKYKENENELNSLIVRRVEQLKTSWQKFHRERYYSFLDKHQLPYKADPKSNTFERPFKYGCYRCEYRLVNRLGENALYFSTVIIYHPGIARQDFFVSPFDEKIDFRIDYKRIVKDTLFLCTNFLSLATIVEKELKIKWECK